MNRRDALRRGSLALGGAIALGGCTEQALEDAETEPPFVEDSQLTPEEADLPIDRTHAVIEEGIEAATDADIEDVESFEGFLEEQGITVEKLTEGEGIIEVPLEEGDEKTEEEIVDEGDPEEGLATAPIIELEYVLEERAEEGAVHTLGLVAGGYAALLEAGHGSELLEATVLNPSHEPFGSYDIERTWAEEYNAGEISAAEYGDEVLTTMQTE